MNIIELVDVTGVLVLLLVVLTGALVIYARAVRVDRGHRQVLGSRATLEAQLVHRAQSALEVSTVPGLDPASALILARAAHEALDAEGPVVDDGLDPASRTSPAARPERSRALIESDLSRVLRAVLSPTVREELAGDPVSADVLAGLDRAAWRLVLARRFHNTHVTQARRLRSRRSVRLLHLAGHAPMPATFDMDDDAGPEGVPGTGAVTGRDDAAEENP